MKKSFSVICLLLALLIPASALACEHNYGPWRTKTSATCTRQGHQFKYCLKCDHWEQRHTSKLPHTPGEKTVTKAPTCTETGREENLRRQLLWKEFEATVNGFLNGGTEK